MKETISLFRNNRTYFLGFLLLLCAGFVWLLLDGKNAGFYPLTAYRPFWLNVFFINFTSMGDGIFALCLVALLFYYKRKNEALAFLYSFLISGIIVQAIKNLVLTSSPKLFFEPGRYLFIVDDADLLNHSGFPSGHTATAFALATVLILLLQHKKWQLPVLLAAFLVGYSRMYLAQHSLTDVLAGSFIGSLSGLAAVYMAKNMTRIKMSFRKMHRVENKRRASLPNGIQPS